MSSFEEILSENDNIITLEKLAKYTSKPILISQYRYEDVDGLGGEFKILTDFDTLEKSLVDKEFKTINIGYLQDYIQVEYYSGYRGAETIHKYYNIDQKNLQKFKDIVDKYKDNITDVFEE